MESEQSAASQQDKWDARYRQRDQIPEPPLVLKQNLHLLPASGNVLDLACGLGAGAMLLARQGLSVEAWDLSPVAIERLAAAALGHGLDIKSVVRDVERHPPGVASFDVILVSHFLERSLANILIDALKPGGLLFYQTYTRIAVDEGGPSNPAFRLAENELLRLFSPLKIRFYREEGLCGDVSKGCRDLAMLVAEK